MLLQTSVLLLKSILLYGSTTVYSPSEGHPGYSQFGAIMNKNKAARNVQVHVFV